MNERKRWFIDRIELRVYRNNTHCQYEEVICKMCLDIYNNGIVILDDMHANYLFMLESEMTREGTPLRYFDTIEERDKYEQSL